MFISFQPNIAGNKGHQSGILLETKIDGQNRFNHGFLPWFKENEAGFKREVPLLPATGLMKREVNVNERSGKHWLRDEFIESQVTPKNNEERFTDRCLIED